MLHLKNQASPTAKKALIKDVIYGIIVNPNNGLSIQFRLAGGLNSDATTTNVVTSEELENNVIALDNRKPQQQPPADAGTAEGGHSHNLGIFGSQVLGNGSERRTKFAYAWQFFNKIKGLSQGFWRDLPTGEIPFLLKKLRFLGWLGHFLSGLEFIFNFFGRVIAHTRTKIVKPLLNKSMPYQALILAEQ